MPQPMPGWPSWLGSARMHPFRRADPCRKRIKVVPQTPKRERLTIAPEEAKKPWTGDLDGMVKRRFIRILTVYSKTFYTVDKVSSAARPSTPAACLWRT